MIKLQALQHQAYQVRKLILDISYKAHVGHIAPALSITDILTILYHHVLHIPKNNPTHPHRDRLIFSKGHAAAALYAVLYLKKRITKKQIYTYCQDGGIFGVHPDYNPKNGIELTTGSLGHGLSVGVGMAMGLQHPVNREPITVNPKPHIYVLMSDAELNEGSVWEAIMFAGHHKIDNLTVIIDNNGNQAFGKTKDILNLHPISQKFSTFGWDTSVAGGHNMKELHTAFAKRDTQTKPHIIVANTIAGYGVSYMENKIDWHYWPMNEEQYKQAVSDIRDI